MTEGSLGTSSQITQGAWPSILSLRMSQGSAPEKCHKHGFLEGFLPSCVVRKWTLEASKEILEAGPHFVGMGLQKPSACSHVKQGRDLPLTEVLGFREGAGLLSHAGAYMFNLYIGGICLIS